MNWHPEDILSILDQCSNNFTFPMLDNGYVYLAATRMSLYRSTQDWAIVIEVFGFSPRAAIPDTHIYTFASQVHDRPPATNYVSYEAYENNLASNPHNESRFIYPIAEGEWQDPDELEFLARGNYLVTVRDKILPTLKTADYLHHRVILQKAPRVQVFEFCRVLAGLVRDDVLANPEERRANIKPEMQLILQLEEWSHPNVVDKDCPPSTSETFQQLAKVLVTGDTTFYRPTGKANTHWENWPEGGTL